MIGWLAKALRGSRHSLQSCSKDGMNCEGQVLSIPCAWAVDERSNSMRLKCSVSFKFVIII